MIATLACREHLVARRYSTFADHGLDADPAIVADRIAELHYQLYPGYPIDELLVRPRESLRLCDQVRQMLDHFDLPDDVILRALLARRKQG